MLRDVPTFKMKSLLTKHVLEIEIPLNKFYIYMKLLSLLNITSISLRFSYITFNVKICNLCY